jgi:hypothetical protein
MVDLLICGARGLRTGTALAVRDQFSKKLFLRAWMPNNVNWVTGCLTSRCDVKMSSSIFHDRVCFVSASSRRILQTEYPPEGRFQMWVKPDQVTHIIVAIIRLRCPPS